MIYEVHICNGMASLIGYTIKPYIVDTNSIWFKCDLKINKTVTGRDARQKLRLSQTPKWITFLNTGFWASSWKLAWLYLKAILREFSSKMYVTVHQTIVDVLAAVSSNHQPAIIPRDTFLTNHKTVQSSGGVNHSSMQPIAQPIALLIFV